MVMPQEETREAGRRCPHCRESIARLAIRCRHCRSALLPREPAHGGVCPFCREDIRRDAAVCHHCGANVLVLIDASVFTGNGCRPDPTLRAAGSGPGGSGGGDEAPEPWWRVCFMIPVPDCHIEPGKPVDSKDGAGFEDDEIVCDGWKMVKVCIPW